MGPREDIGVLEKRKVSCCTGIRNPDRSGYSVVAKPALAEEILISSSTSENSTEG